MKYLVKIGTKGAKVFNTYDEAIQYFSKNWHFGETYSITKVNFRGVIAGY